MKTQENLRNAQIISLNTQYVSQRVAVNFTFTFKINGEFLRGDRLFLSKRAISALNKCYHSKK